MTDQTTDLNEIAEQIIAQSCAADAPFLKGSDGKAVVARLRTAVSPALLRHVAAEAEMATPQPAFAAGAECFLASIASTLAGYLSATEEDCRHNSIVLLKRAIQTVSGGPDETFAVVADRKVRGPSQ